MQDRFRICALALPDCRLGLFKDFERRSTDTHIWKYIDGKGTLVEQPFLREWDAEKRERMEENLRQSLREGAAAFAAWDDRELAGYCVVRPEPLGSRGQYLKLDMLHISVPYRGQGLGGRLFGLACGAARERGAEKLIICSAPNETTVAFYRHMDCMETMEFFSALAKLEPEDYQIEFELR